MNAVFLLDKTTVTREILTAANKSTEIAARNIIANVVLVAYFDNIVGMLLIFKNLLITRRRLLKSAHNCKRKHKELRAP